MRAAVVCIALGAAACGGGAPLLHPAHTLPAGRVSFGAGVSGHLPAGGLSSAREDRDEVAQSSGASSPAESERFTAGELVDLAIAPGASPFVAARVGLGGDNEAGLTYAGRVARLDGRHAFEFGEHYALSVGAGASALLTRSGDVPAERLDQASGLRATELESATGFGFDVPVVVGYRSDADVVMAWVGVRGGYERGEYELSVSTISGPRGADADSKRWWAGGLLGFAIGLPPIQIAVELDAAYQHVEGALVSEDDRVAASVSGLSLTPSGGILAKF